VYNVTMKGKPSIYITVFLLTSALCTQASEVGHSLNITHPAIPESSRMPSQLIQVQDDQGNPQEYHMNVDSVVCGDEECEIIKVRIWWDVLGGYERYELPQGANLTKMGHVPFTPEDHKKLHAILSDPTSALAQYPVEELNSPATEEQAVDAVTTATPLFYQNTVVSGAVYTCYTLWHWANGDATKKIRQWTEKSCALEQLLRYVDGKSDKLSVFAMEQLAKRGVYDQKIVDTVIARADQGDVLLAEAASNYFKSSLRKMGGVIYYNAMERLFEVADSQKRILCLRSLSEVKAEAPDGFYDRMAAWLPRLETYFEVNLLLTLLEKRASRPDETVKHGLVVMDSKNFLIARRAFWFLDKQSLTAMQRSKVEAFRAKFEARL